MGIDNYTKTFLLILNFDMGIDSLCIPIPEVENHFEYGYREKEKQKEKEKEK